MEEFTFTWDFVHKIIEFPHLLGPLMGYHDLVPIHSEWIHYCFDMPPGVNRAFQSSRNTYKTSSCTMLGFVYRKLIYPDTADALIQETHTVAVETLKSIVDIFKIPAIRELFKFVHGSYPEVVKYPEGSVTFSFKKTITRAGSIDAAGIASLKTGMHYDYMMLDDIVSIESRLSKATRDRQNLGVEEIFANIIKRNGNICFLGTPWHINDAWSMKCVPPIKKYDVYEAIKHGIITEEKAMAIKAITTPSMWAANYLLVHQSDETSIFKNPKYDYWQYAHKHCYNAVAHLDAKWTGVDTWALTIATYLPDGFIQVVGFSGPEHVDERQKFIKDMYRRYKCSTILIEDNADKGALAKELSRPDENGPGLCVESYHENMNKHHKIITYGKPMFEKCIFDCSMFQTSGTKVTDTKSEQELFMAQLLDYQEKQSPDDAADSFSSLMRYFKDISVQAIPSEIETLYSIK